MRLLATMTLFLPAVLLLAGCEQKIPKEELGTVVFEVPIVPGAGKPYAMPQLGPKAADNASGDADDDD